MSLLSQWTIDKTNMNTSIDKSEDIIIFSGSSTSLESKFKEKNKWRCLKYNINDGSNTPNVSKVKAYPVVAVQYRAQDTSQNWNWGDRYIGVRECWVYCNRNYTLSTTAWTDDAGRVYLNNSSITTTVSCTGKTVSLPFKAGLNHLEIFFTEGTGGDAAYITTDLSAQSWVDWMYACYK